MNEFIPKPAAVVREGLIIFGGLLIAAFVLSKLPKLKAFVEGNSLQVKDSNGNIFWS